jgi:hypothetical protein
MSPLERIMPPRFRRNHLLTDSRHFDEEKNSRSHRLDWGCRRVQRNGARLWCEPKCARGNSRRQPEFFRHDRVRVAQRSARSPGLGARSREHCFFCSVRINGWSDTSSIYCRPDRWRASVYKRGNHGFPWRFCHSDNSAVIRVTRRRVRPGWNPRQAVINNDSH